jgi:hypothetical protein
MSNEQGMPALPITLWAMGEEVEAALHNYAREYAAQQTAELQSRLDEAVAALKQQAGLLREARPAVRYLCDNQPDNDEGDHNAREWENLLCRIDAFLAKQEAA